LPQPPFPLSRLALPRCVPPLQGPLQFLVVRRLSIVELFNLPLRDTRLTLKIWDPYTYSYYFKTVYRDVRICG